MEETRFYICQHCGNLVGMIHSSGVPMVCCGDPMTMLQAGSVDASVEKHVPVVATAGGVVTVSIGSVEHPMVDEHFIQWVYLLSEQGAQRKNLLPGQKPELQFHIAADDKVVAAYAYCNLHGLWKS